MRYRIPSVLCETFQAQRIAGPIITSLLLAVGVLLSPSDARGGPIFPFVGPKLFGDDLHWATVDPFPPTPISTITSDAPGESPWINTGLAAFMAANPANGSGPSGQAWTFNWAGAAAEAAVESGIKILAYYPWVVTPPRVGAANGGVLRRGAAGEQGGAVLSLKYTPQPGTLRIPNLQWIQAYTGTLYGAAVPQLLGNDRSHPFASQSNLSPWYGAVENGVIDNQGAAGTLPRGGAWFLDSRKTLGVSDRPLGAVNT